MAKKKVVLPEVKPGQVWIDNDARQGGRRELNVREVVKGEKSKSDPRWVCQIFYGGRDTGRMAKVRQSRFKPTSTGYRLKEEKPNKSPAASLPPWAPVHATEPSGTPQSGMVGSVGPTVEMIKVPVEVPVKMVDPVTEWGAGGAAALDVDSGSETGT
jgi:hypothetical protein